MCYGTILSESLARAAKSHRCEGCDRPIEKGELHRVSSIKEEGEIGRTRLCRVCAATIHASMDPHDGDGCYYGDFGNDGVKDVGGWKKVLAAWRSMLAGRRGKKRGAAA
jgi:hypothetical protein